MLDRRLAQFTEEGVFRGAYRGPDRGALDESFETNLARMFASRTTPRLSGVQIKTPTYLNSDRDLLPSIELPFTHILKPAGTSGFEHMPVVEWLCIELGRLAGFEAPATTLVEMPVECRRRF